VTFRRRRQLRRAQRASRLVVDRLVPAHIEYADGTTEAVAMRMVVFADGSGYLCGVDDLPRGAKLVVTVELPLR
jgi:hypothetical protein